jgi:hypothetical protein
MVSQLVSEHAFHVDQQCKCALLLLCAQHHDLHITGVLLQGVTAAAAAALHHC